MPGRGEKANFHFSWRALLRSPPKRGPAQSGGPAGSELDAEPEFVAAMGLPIRWTAGIGMVAVGIGASVDRLAHQDDFLGAKGVEDRTDEDQPNSSADRQALGGLEIELVVRVGFAAPARLDEVGVVGDFRNDLAVVLLTSVAIEIKIVRRCRGRRPRPRCRLRCRSNSQNSCY